LTCQGLWRSKEVFIGSSFWLQSYFKSCIFWWLNMTLKNKVGEIQRDMNQLELLSLFNRTFESASLRTRLRKFNQQMINFKWIRETNPR
jgi:hypothetical protein